MKDFDIEKLERKNIYRVPDNLFQNIQDKVLTGVNDFDVEKLERKNIYKVSDDLFETVQNNVMSEIRGFNVENLERKNIYKLPEHLFESVQNKVLAEIKVEKKAPIIRLNWAYTAAACLALVFGGSLVYNGISDVAPANNLAEVTPKKESQIAYETLQADLTSVESDNQTAEDQNIKPVVSHAAQNVNTVQKVKTVSASAKQTEKQMNEYLDSFTSSEIADLAVNGNQDVYLDLYN
ncbi:hypothetical protein [Chryseobacterium caseinilyticum]|uniref:hypothetical protein n=1 Tax=Chryseobacterium caseinilyticum TaxID=2771428 RepID=UPI001E338F73|nr:hypothetical protein [Chryseobacterium caseinilyticum]